MANTKPLTADAFIKKWGIIERRDPLENRRTGWRCPVCRATSGFLSTIDHKRSCTVPDYGK